MRQALVIESSEQFDSSMIARWLTRANYRPQISKPGLAAMNHLKLAQYDVVFAQYVPPEEAAQQLIPDIRRLLAEKQIPFVILNGLLADGKASKLGNLHYLPSPLTEESLLEFISVELTKRERGPQFQIDVGVVNAFIRAAKSVVSGFGIHITSKGDLERVSLAEGLRGDVSSIVSIDSEKFRGKLCISFEKSAYLKLISKMLMEERHELTDDIREGVAEVTNMIFGQAKRELEKYQIKQAIPINISGNDHRISHQHGSVAMAFPYGTDSGRFYVQVVAEPIN